LESGLEDTGFFAADTVIGWKFNRQDDWRCRQIGRRRREPKADDIAGFLQSIRDF